MLAVEGRGNIKGLLAELGLDPGRTSHSSIQIAKKSASILPPAARCVRSALTPERIWQVLDGLSFTEFNSSHYGMALP
jgi:hypothetical protein